jgi:hypothetical protein
MATLITIFLFVFVIAVHTWMFWETRKVNNEHRALFTRVENVIDDMTHINAEYRKVLGLSEQPTPDTSPVQLN